MISILLDITFEASCWVFLKTTKIMYSSINYFTKPAVNNNVPAIQYSGDKRKDVIYAAGVLHHENLIDNKSYEAIIDSALLLQIKDDPPKYSL